MGPALDWERAKGKTQALIRCHCPNRLKGLGLGLRVLTLGFVEQRQIVEAGGHVGVLRGPRG